MPAGLPAGIGFPGPIPADNTLRNKGLRELGRNRRARWSLCLVSKARLRLSKNRSKLAGKLGETCLQPRGELCQRSRPTLHLDLTPNPNVNLNPSLYREMLARS